MDVDLNSLEVQFVEYYKNDLKMSGVDDSLKMCAIEQMWKYLSDRTKRFQYEIIVTKNAANQDKVMENKDYLESLFHMPINSLMPQVSGDLEQANLKAFSVCSAITN